MRLGAGHMSQSTTVVTSGYTNLQVPVNEAP